ncbi:MAG: right-handed parallel beta-helix repeat-containing protein [Candidatus Aenigmarchaeota archaeon]|nr:right-handed parallel beta-helix repeat-containing protein [Candidatus Aenigmarchaeota archaeon]
MKTAWIAFLIVLLPSVLAIQCTIRQNSCNPGEFCLFSRFQANNTHVGNCTAYGNLTCCSDPYLTNVEIKSSCSLGQNGTISMFNYTNSHAEVFTEGNYNYRVCVDCPWICTLRSSCLSGEYALVSMNSSTNSHIGEPGFYANQLCCKIDDVLPIASNIGQNVSSINVGQAVKIYAFWQDNGNISHAILETNETGVWQNKSIYGSPLTIRANSGWSNFTWQNSSFSSTVVSWRIYANDTCGNWFVTGTNNIQIGILSGCQNITSSGYYRLDNDVSAIGTCFNITANNVELDCNWKRINYAQSASGYGVYVEQKNNVTVKNCRMSGGSYDYSYGIYFYYSNFSTAQSVNITTRGTNSYGVAMDSSKNNTIKNSNITIIGTSYGIITHTSANNTIESNNITTNADSASGIFMYQSTNNTINLNHISTSGDYAYGVYLYSSENNLVKSNYLRANGWWSYVNMLRAASKNQFVNNSAISFNSGSYGFYVYESSFNLTLINNTINTTADHIRFRENSSMQIINTSFNKSKVSWESTALNAWINVSYYVDVYVRNFTDPINAAQVNITNYTNSLIHSSYTGSNGYIETQLLPEFFANGSYVYSCPSSQSNLSCASPYNFSASKENMFNSTIEYINQSKIVEIILFPKIISVSLSEKLSQGIFFTSVNGSLNNTQLPVEIEKWNNATWNYNKTPSHGDNKTMYWIYNSGNVNQDFCLKANADLTCYNGPCTTMTISASNVAFTNSTFNNATYPSFSSDRNLSTSYVKIAENVMPGEYHYFRFWLYVERDKPSGIYNTTFSVRNVESGSPC